MDRHTLLRGAAAALLAAALAGCGSGLLDTEDDDAPVSLTIGDALLNRGFYGAEIEGSFVLSLQGTGWSDSLIARTATASESEPVDVSDYFDVLLYDRADGVNKTAYLVGDAKVQAVSAANAMTYSGATTYDAASGTGVLTVLLSLDFNAPRTADGSGELTSDTRGYVRVQAHPAALLNDSYQLSDNSFLFTASGIRYDVEDAPDGATMASAYVKAVKDDKAGENKPVSALQLRIGDDGLLEEVDAGTQIATLTVGESSYPVIAAAIATKGSHSVSAYIEGTALVGVTKDANAADTTLSFATGYTSADDAQKLQNGLTKTSVRDIRFGQSFNLLSTDAEVQALIKADDYQAGVTLKTGTGRGRYADFTIPTSQNSRGGYMKLTGAPTSGTYVVEFDAKLSAGNNQSSEVNLLSDTPVNIYQKYLDDNSIEGSSKQTYNYGMPRYIFNLNTTNSTKWTVNGGPTVTLGRTTWYHYVVTVNIDEGSVRGAIYTTDGATVLEEQSLSVPDGSELTLQYLHLLDGRYAGSECIDNVTVYVPAE